MIDPADRLGVAEEADADDQAHAEPERDAGDDGQARHLAGRQPRRPVDPETHRAAGDQGKAERERNRIAGEGSERGQPIRHVSLEMPERQARRSRSGRDSSTRRSPKAIAIWSPPVAAKAASNFLGSMRTSVRTKMIAETEMISRLNANPSRRSSGRRARIAAAQRARRSAESADRRSLASSSRGGRSLTLLRHARPALLASRAAYKPRRARPASAPRRGRRAAWSARKGRRRRPEDWP